MGTGFDDIYGPDLPLRNVPLETAQEALERRVKDLERKVTLQTMALKLAADTLREMAEWMKSHG